MSLSPRYQKFVSAYVGSADGNATTAAAMAGFKGNRLTLGTTGSRLLKRDDIRDAIDHEVEKTLIGLRPNEIVSLLSEIALSAPRVPDRIRALTLLGRRHGMFTDRVHVTDVEYVIGFDEVDEEDEEE